MADPNLPQASQSVDPTLQKTEQEGKPEVKTSPEVDYKAKFAESTREVQRIIEENKRLKNESEVLKGKAERWDKAEPVLTKIASNEKILNAIEEAEAEEKPIQSPLKVIEPLLDERLEKRVKPLESQLAEIREQTLKNRISTYQAKHPEIDFEKKFDEEASQYFQTLLKGGYQVEDALDKAFYLKSVDEAKQAGKREALIELYQANQAAISGGGAPTPAEGFIEPLTDDEKKVAKMMKITEEEYRKWKGK